MLVWIDESGCAGRNCIRKYGYSIRDIRPVDHRILIQGTRYSTKMSVQGIHDVFLAEGTINGERFSSFSSDILTTGFDAIQPTVSHNTG